LYLYLLQFVEVMKMLVGQGFIGEGPQPLGWLQFGRVRGQEVHMYSRRQVHLAAHMPTRSIKHQQYLFACSCAYGLAKLVQGQRERGYRHSGE
jgi:hypothetical protein